jgi:predicted RNA-binding Zn-ribbon protein involved in translation (DUF1610 family)
MREADGKLTRACAGPNGSHEYAEKLCPECGAQFCFSCSLWSNRSEGGKYEPDSELCPACGHDYYAS